MTNTTRKEKVKVLYLDDEDNNLRSFKAAFRRDYQIYTANNTEDAFSIIKTQSPQVIFSDQRMPVTSGVDFFNAVRQVFPEPVRILITGYTDVNDIIEAINKGNIYRYITKPWNEPDIKVAIENAYDLYLTRRSLKDKVEDLEKVNEELNRFVYSVSHDLRAPIASVLGLIKVAEIEVEDPTAKDLFKSIDQSTIKLDLLVNNIINYYKNSKASGRLEEIDINELMEDVLNNLHCESKNASFQLEREVDQRAKFIGDAFRIRIILSHLISNAAKFKKPNQEKANIKLRFEISDAKVKIVVSDEGMGILSEHMEQIFKMFFKRKQDLAGSGLGLYVVKEALSKMGGQIDVKSTPNQGSDFRLNFPNHTLEEDE